MKISLYTETEDILKVVNEINDKNILLHANGSMLIWWMNPDLIDSIAIAENEYDKIGAVIVTKEIKNNYFNIGVYVKSEYRKKGIGGQLLQTIKNRKDKFRIDGTGFRRKMFNKYLEGKIE